jgi:hypothetical protein
MLDNNKNNDNDPVTLVKKRIEYAGEGILE